jgi:hypothetical protein
LHLSGARERYLSLASTSFCGMDVPESSAVMATDPMSILAHANETKWSNAAKSIG